MNSFHSHIRLHVQSFRLISYDASAPQVGPLTGYEPQDLIERTLYQYVHADDMNGIRASHITCKLREPPDLMLKFLASPWLEEFKRVELMSYFTVN